MAMEMQGERNEGPETIIPPHYIAFWINKTMYGKFLEYIKCLGRGSFYCPNAFNSSSLHQLGQIPRESDCIFSFEGLLMENILKNMVQ